MGLSGDSPYSETNYIFINRFNLLTKRRKPGSIQVRVDCFI